MTPTEFQAAFPVLADVDVVAIQRHIDASAAWFDVARWDTFYAEGLGNWVAHRIVTEAVDAWQISHPAGDRPGVAAPGDREITSKTVDTTSISYSTMVLLGQFKDPYMRTTFGQRYRYLAEMVGIGAVAV